MSRRRAHPLRVTAALLAWVGLVLVPTRVLADCPMVEDVSAPAAAPALAEAKADPHAEHGNHAQADVASDTSSDAPAPPHPDCPDLLHCAVAALTPSCAALVETLRPLEDANLGAASAPRAPPRVVDTPPPRA